MGKLEFITDRELKENIKNTISSYEKTLNEVDLKKFNKNIIDPIKLIFDLKFYGKGFDKLIEDEVRRQKDKTISNAIGYFHQNMFKYINNCEVPKEGFDVIYTKKDGTKIYAEIKNKHNTMNSSSSQKTYINMQKIIEKDAFAECYLVEVISKKRQSEVWKISLDGKKIENERIKCIPIDKFYEIVTGDKEAFYKICMKLPNLIDDIIKNKELQVGTDTVIDEIKEINPKDPFKALYMLAFKKYEGFNKL